jgi:hypothetical protein
MSIYLPEDWKLPEDLIGFLEFEQQLQYKTAECCAGEIKLKHLDELTPCEIVVMSFDTEYEIDDPMAGLGYYMVRAVGLVATRNTEVEDNQVLLWFPDYQQYGQWDREHQNAIRFVGISWKDICGDPVRFLEAKWTMEEKTARPVAPWKDSVGIAREGDPPY